ncbi:hypothetical protein HaLaN_12687 [Haematococcus lacustris]|uniref:Uncharacterized protein n=1 Tax=Haematococcus lacustris TaxID=44745 RepID=A0A699Z1B1_HAELA|nr:hypothetical protein HaLaN_12687 [Haematococcus lacustris]
MGVPMKKRNSKDSLGNGLQVRRADLGTPRQQAPLVSKACKQVVSDNMCDNPCVAIDSTRRGHVRRRQPCCMACPRYGRPRCRVTRASSSQPPRMASCGAGTDETMAP